MIFFLSQDRVTSVTDTFPLEIPGADAYLFSHPHLICLLFGVL